MLVNDDRSKVDVNLMPDPRAAHYWDGERSLGTWLPKQEGYESVAFGPIAWDIYFLYAPDAKWEEAPEPQTAFGRTVISESANLERSIRELIAPN